MLSFTVQSIGHRPLHSLTILDDENRMAGAQHLPQDVVRASSGSEELAHRMKKKHFHHWKD